MVDDVVAVTIRYQGEPAGASMLVRMLQQSGVAVEWTPPPERRGLEDDATEVVVTLASTGSAVAIAAAVRKFRNRVRRARVDVDGRA
jgi:hypothetical protein